MKTEVVKTYWIKEKVRGCYVTGIRLAEQQISVTKDITKARKYRDDKVNKVRLKLELFCTNQRWEVVPTGESVELHYTDDIKEYKALVIKGILDKFSDKEKSGVHAVTAEYIEGMISSRKNEHEEEELPHEKLIPTTWHDCYEDNVSIEDAVEEMAPGCKTLYYGHMSVL